MTTFHHQVEKKERKFLKSGEKNGLKNFTTTSSSLEYLGKEQKIIEKKSKKLKKAKLCVLLKNQTKKIIKQKQEKNSIQSKN